MLTLALLGGVPVRSRPFGPWPASNPNDLDRLTQVLTSGNWGGYPYPNRHAADFATRFAAHHGAAYGSCVANGTVAILIALRAIGLEFGDEVIVPAYTWDGTATAILDAGGVPVFADVDPDSYCLDPEAVRRAITPRTRAIVPVHLAMRFADMDALAAIARDYNLAIVEDCAHAHGGQWRGKGAGAIGDAGCFSLQSSKLMTSGEGGMVITSRLDVFELMQSVINCGRASGTDTFGRRITGSNYRITEFQAAVLLGQLEQLADLTARRAASAVRLSKMLAAIPGIRPLPPQPQVTREAIYQYVFRYDEGDSGVSRDMFCGAMDAEGIPSDGRFYEPVYRSDLYKPSAKHFPQLTGQQAHVVCPVSERAAYRESVWLPHFLLLDETGAEDIARAVQKVMENREALRQADPALAALKSMSRADRPRVEAKKNY